MSGVVRAWVRGAVCVLVMASAASAQSDKPVAEMTAEERAAEAAYVRKALAGLKDREQDFPGDLGEVYGYIHERAWQLGDAESAHEAVDRLVAWYEATLEELDAAARLNHLANRLRTRGDYERSRRIYEKVLKIGETRLGPRHVNVGATLNNLGGVAGDMGDYATARECAERALEIFEAELGPDHPDVAGLQSNMGALLTELGEYDAARPLLERSLRVRLEALGPQHPAVADTLDNLGILHSALGDREAARSHYEQALEIREAALGPQHLAVANVSSNLGALYSEIGDYEAARLLAERALRIQETALGPDHPTVAGSLNNLGALLTYLGDYEAAQPLMERALTIQEATFGPDHPAVAGSLANLADLHRDIGDYPRARELYERTLRIREAALGLEHPSYAAGLNRLAILLWHQEDDEAARRLYEQVLVKQQEVLGPDHPDVAMALNNLGAALWRLGDHEGARPLYERSIAIIEGAGQDSSLLAVACLNNLSLLAADQGHWRTAWELVDRVTLARRGRLGRRLASMPEGKGFLYLATLGEQRDALLTFAARIDDAEIRRRTYEHLLAWKGEVGRWLVEGRARGLADLTVEQQGLISELRAVQGRLSALTTRTDVPDREAHEQRLVALRAERERLERVLRESSPGSRESQPVTLDDVVAGLPERSAVVDLFLYQTYVPARFEGDRFVRRGRWTEPHLSAWIVRSDGDDVGRVDLGPAAPLEALASAWLTSVVAGDPVAGRGTPVGDQPGVRSGAGTELRAALWDPLAAQLDGIGRVFLSPDGFLGTLPFEVLPGEDGRFLIEDFAFVYLGATASLAAREPSTFAPDALLAVGGVDFERHEDADATGDVGDVGDDRGLQRWPALPATASESSAVAAMHAEAFGEAGRQILLQSTAATEEALKQRLPDARIAHLATHGYFQPEGLRSLWADALGDTGVGRSMTETERRLVGQHPGLLSGLVCAGANRPPPEGRDDGYLTAEEVTWLDLSGVDLVVLSACETGLGRAQSGEGLIGLRRAFHLAGADTVVSSLWSVEDQSTAELMQAYYANLFIEGLGRHDALRAAQLQMLERNRADGGAPRPSTWGPFVLSGEWR